MAAFESEEHLTFHRDRGERRCSCAWYLAAKEALTDRPCHPLAKQAGRRPLDEPSADAAP